jgi:hypothetical protein
MIKFENFLQDPKKSLKDIFKSGGIAVKDKTWPNFPLAYIEVRFPRKPGYVVHYVTVEVQYVSSVQLKTPEGKLKMLSVSLYFVSHVCVEPRIGGYQ